MKVYIHQNSRPPLLVDPDYFFEQMKSEEDPEDADNDVALVRRIARGIQRTPAPSLRMDLSMIQAGALVGIHMMAVNLREANYCMGVYGNWAIKPLDDEENGFCVSELDSGALTAGDLRTFGDLLAVRNIKLIDTRGFFDRLQAFVGWQLAQPGTQIDVESFGRYGQEMRNLVESIRRQHQALN